MIKIAIVSFLMCFIGSSVFAKCFPQPSTEITLKVESFNTKTSTLTAKVLQAKPPSPAGKYRVVKTGDSINVFTGSETGKFKPNQELKTKIRPRCFDMLSPEESKKLPEFEISKTPSYE